MKEWSVNPSLTTVDAGKIHFNADNQGTTTHELAVVSIGSDGQKREVAEIEDLGAGKKGSFSAKLKPGRYELACLLVPGEAGATADHYRQGMHTEFIIR
jgi:hypothetical protein